MFARAMSNRVWSYFFGRGIIDPVDDIRSSNPASNPELLDALTSLPGIDWQRVDMFHLDEYIGLPADHPASFRNYLLARLINKVGLTHHHLLDGEQGGSRLSARADVLFREHRIRCGQDARLPVQHAER